MVNLSESLVQKESMVDQEDCAPRLLGQQPPGSPARCRCRDLPSGIAPRMCHSAQHPGSWHQAGAPLGAWPRSAAAISLWEDFPGKGHGLGLSSKPHPQPLCSRNCPPSWPSGATPLAAQPSPPLLLPHPGVVALHPLRPWGYPVGPTAPVSSVVTWRCPQARELWLPFGACLGSQAGRRVQPRC